jgi:hypothetical protein
VTVDGRSFGWTPVPLADLFLASSGRVTGAQPGAARASSRCRPSRARSVKGAVAARCSRRRRPGTAIWPAMEGRRRRSRLGSQRRAVLGQHQAPSRRPGWRPAPRSRTRSRSARSRAAAGLASPGVLPTPDVGNRSSTPTIPLRWVGPHGPRPRHSRCSKGVPPGHDQGLHGADGGIGIAIVRCVQSSAVTRNAATMWSKSIRALAGDTPAHRTDH